MKSILRVFFISLVPAVLLFFGAGKMNAAFPNTDTTSHQIIAYISGLFITTIILPVKLEKAINQRTQQEKVISMLLSNLKSSFNDKLKFQLKCKDLVMNIRVFRPETGFVAWFRRTFMGIHKFYIISHPNLTSDGLNGLKFTVRPESQGIVGRAYNDKKLLFDNELQNNIEEDIYNLTDTQKHKTAGTSFVIASPIITDNEKIMAIVTFDSQTKVSLPASEEWKSTVRDTCAIIHTCIPFICKNKQHA